MPSEAPLLPTQTEKPNHYTYLKEFRTQQCPLFLQHKCTQHRPFTCFHWHFMNQRRRRPIRKRDGTFNYSPDTYCTKYDETTGICPEGDDCCFLHRTAGDTERRYHLRYYKTSVCVHETDAKGNCIKNGPHCAFAHGVRDLRPPVHDVRELQAMESGMPGLDTVAESPLGTTVEKDRQINEDPKWNDTNYVLANYKTDPCKRPPRLCRQGYACPSYHNTRDRRRSPKKIKYRSTPCPNVKHGDDWGDPSQCENQDNCSYCHTRTEQQFHPEIYKSSKCNDMVQHGYCPRGPFCAFAHVEQEMTTQRELAAASENSLAAFLSNVLPDSREDSKPEDLLLEEQRTNGGEHMGAHSMANGGSFFSQAPVSMSVASLSNNFLSSSFPEPIGKGRTSSISSSVASDCGGFMGFPGLSMSKAPGSEREDNNMNLRQQMQAIETDHTLDAAEKQRRKQNLLLLHSLNMTGPLSPNFINNFGAGGNSALNPFNAGNSTTMSPNAPSFYPPGDTVESVIGNALEEDLNLGELSLSSIDREMARDNDNDTNSVCSSLSAGFPASQPSQGGYLGATSVPVTIPSAGGTNGTEYHSNTAVGSVSPTNSPIGSLPPASFAPSHLQQQQQKQEQQLQGAASAFLSQPNPGKFSAPGFSDFVPGGAAASMSPQGSISQSPLLAGGAFMAAATGLNNNGGGGSMVNGYHSSGGSEMHRLKDELATNKAKLQQWEEGISQARGACEAWKKEAEESKRKAKLIEDERIQAYKQRDEALAKVSQQSKELEFLRNNPYLHTLKRGSELEALPLPLIKQLQAQLILDLDMLEKLVYQHEAMKCMVCHENSRSVAVTPCNHYVMCDRCAARRTDCPYCNQKIQQRSSMVLPASTSANAAAAAAAATAAM